MPSTKASKKRRRESKLLPELYENDLGIEGIKTKNVTTTNYSIFQGSMKLTKEDIAKIKKRKSRFGDKLLNKPIDTNGVEQQDPLHYPLSAGRNEKKENSETPCFEPFIGTSVKLEKNYLRLTTYPRKEDVRPYEVLVKSLSHIKEKYVKEEDFHWVNSQLKSIRQDITCQAIRNKFVLDVYETHARILLENGDLNEFNQCQTMIRSLTEKGYGEINENDSEKDLLTESISHDNNLRLNEIVLQQSKPSLLEFRSYALLYALVRNSRLELIRELDRMNDLLIPNGSNSLDDLCCEHALQVVRSVEETNYRKFFMLYGSAPHMTAFLMDFLLKRIRDQAYERIISSYRPNVSVENIREWLHFDDLEETRSFLRQRNTVFVEIKGEAPFWIDCKASK